MEILQLLIDGLAQGCVYGLVALGFVLIYKATEMINFAQSDIMMLGAFVGYSFIGLLELPYWLGFMLAVIVMVAFGYLLEALVLRPVIGQPPFAVLMLSIGLGFIFRAIAGAIWGNEPVSLATPYSGQVLTLGGLIIGWENAAIIIGTLLLCGLLYGFFRYTHLGIAMQAASQNQLAAYYMGIPVKKVFSLVWGISAGIAAVAGILMAPISLIDPQMGFLGIKAFAAAVVGGFGSLPGTLIGGFIIGATDQFAGLYLPAGFQESSAYLILLLMLVVRPRGLFAQMHRKKV